MVQLVTQPDFYRDLPFMYKYFAFATPRYFCILERLWVAFCWISPDPWDATGGVTFGNRSDVIAFIITPVTSDVTSSAYKHQSYIWGNVNEVYTQIYGAICNLIVVVVVLLLP